MNKHSGATRSAWMDEQPGPAATLLQDISCDVCVIGAGIAGLSVAYQLARSRKRVVVLDDGPIGGGETERTSAHLSWALDDRIYTLEKLHGLEKTRLAVQSHMAAIDEIEATARRENIDCDFLRVDGYLFLPPGASKEPLQKELEALKRVGLSDVEFVIKAPLKTFDTGPCLRFPRQGQFHPLKYLKGLVAAIERMGGTIYTNTRALSVEGGEKSTVKLEGDHSVKCQQVVVATNAPINDMLVIHSKQAPYRTFVVSGPVPKGDVPVALYWDTAQDAEASDSESMNAPYHYVRLQPLDDSRDLLIVGGEDHKTGQADDASSRWERLAMWARERFDGFNEVTHRWSGQVMETADGLAYIGRNPGDHYNVYIATGDSGHGLTHGTIAGLLIRDLITGKPNAWEMVYEPSRKGTSSKTVYLKENLNVAARYGELVTGGEVDSAEQIPLDSGAIIRRGLKKLAVYKDSLGKAHEFSAICPHLKCVVHWNSSEKSWDCPCHGSRFSPLGEVLNGPAVVGLSKAESEADAEQKRAA